MKQFQRNPGNTAFCYYRYSSAAQREASIEQQRNEAQEFAKKNGYTIIKEFEDKAITGTTIDRPGLQYMLYEAKRMRPAYLILYKMDRLSREVHDSFFIDSKLRECGVQIITIAEVLPEDENMRYVLQGLYASMAHNFIISHKAAVTRGMKYNAENALYNGRKILGYVGKKNCRYTIDDKTAPVVKKIFTDYADGKPLQKIADELNDAGYRSVQGKKFVVNSLANILKNRSYIGEYRWGDYFVKDGFPRLISDELFEEAQKMLDKNKRGGKGAAKKLQEVQEEADYWLTSHIYCGECGASMQGVSGTSKSGKIHYYYSCKLHRKAGCTMKNQRKDFLESLVMYTLEKVVNDSSIQILLARKCYEYYQENNSDDGAYLASLEASLKDVQKQLDNFVKAISMGIMNETTAEAMKQLEIRKEMLKEQIEVEKLREKFELTESQVLKFIHSFAGDLNDVRKRTEILDLFVDKIYVYLDKLVITFHYTADKQELNYEETSKIIENRVTMERLLDRPFEEKEVSKETLDSMLDTINGVNGGDNSSSFQ